MSNTGIEAMLNMVLIDNENTNWEMNLNASVNRNEITKLTMVPDTTHLGIQVGGIAGGVGNTIQIHAVGAPMYSFFSYRQLFDRKWQTH